MITVNTQQAILGVPPAFSERCVVRVTETKFGQSKKGNPMLTAELELIGYFNKDNELKTEMERGGKVFKLAGLSIRPVYFTLTSEAITFYQKFHDAANPENPLTGVDESNPDISWMDGLVMQSVVFGSMNPMRKQLTEEEKQEKLAKGEPAIGDIITDEDGNPIQQPSLTVSTWLKRYTAELPPF